MENKTGKKAKTKHITHYLRRSDTNQAYLCRERGKAGHEEVQAGEGNHIDGKLFRKGSRETVMACLQICRGTSNLCFCFDVPYVSMCVYIHIYIYAQIYTRAYICLYTRHQYAYIHTRNGLSLSRKAQDTTAQWAFNLNERRQAYIHIFSQTQKYVYT